MANLAEDLLDAVQAGDISLVENMMDNGADPDTVDEDGYCVLQHATQIESLKLVNELLQAKADPNFTDCDGATALHLAADIPNVRILSRLLEDPDTDPDLQMVDGTTAALFTAIRGEVTALRLLLQGKANPSLRGPNGETCLHHAVKNSHKAMLRMLLNNGANPNIVDNTGMTPCLSAVERGEILILNELLQAKGDVTMQTNDGSTALHLAALLESEKVLQMIIDVGGCNVNAQDGKGNTPMILAAENTSAANIRMIRELIEDGADIFMTNDEGETAGDVLQETHNIDLNSLFDVDGASLDSHGDENLMLKQNQLLHKAQTTFHRFDPNHNGQVSKQEFAKALIAMGVKDKLGERFLPFVTQEFSMMDVNADGVLTFPEFVHCFNRVQTYVRFEKKSRKLKEVKRRQSLMNLEINEEKERRSTSFRGLPQMDGSRTKQTKTGWTQDVVRPGTADPSMGISNSAANARRAARNEVMAAKQPNPSQAWDQVNDRQAMIKSMAKNVASGDDPFNVVVKFVEDKAKKVRSKLESTDKQQTKTVDFIMNFFQQKIATIIATEASERQSYEQKARKFFSLADQNKDGVLSSGEFVKIAMLLIKKAFSDFDKLGLQHVSEIDVQADFKTLDTDQSDDLSFDEFYEFVKVVMVAGLASSITKKLEETAK